MAVRLENAGSKRWSGLSTDAKPVPGAIDADGNQVPAFPPGSLFRETDTRRLYAWSGSDWDFQSEQPRPGPDLTQNEAFLSILSELRRIRLGLEIALQTDIPDPGE